LAPGWNMKFDHIDLRVRDVHKSRAFYNVLMQALGATRWSKGDRSSEWYHPARAEPFFGIHTHGKHVANKSRIAFAVESRKEVDRVAAAIKKAGARAIEGPEVCKSYGQPYYAVFFEDADGNKFEVCCRR
jgi:catechol 2,3-dioxygenase-like lactoylglutathione lyase family enzyme